MKTFLEEFGWFTRLAMFILVVLIVYIVFYVFDEITTKNSSSPQVVGSVVQGSGKFWNITQLKNKKVRLPMYTGITEDGVIFGFVEIDSEEEFQILRSLNRYQPLPLRYLTNMQFKGAVIPILRNDGTPKEFLEPRSGKILTGTPGYYLVPLMIGIVGN